MTEIAPRTKPRNISLTVTFDKDRHELLDALSRSLGVTKSLAVNHLVDLHAGVALEELAAAPVPTFDVRRWHARKLSRLLVEDVAGRVREGSTKADAYRSVEVSPKLGASWEKKGRDDIERERPSLHADLVASLERARAEFNAELLAEARRQGDYKTLLKLMDPEQFSPPSRSTVDVTLRFQALLDWDLLSLEESKQLAMLMRKASPSEDHPALTRTARPAIEAVPADLLEELDAEDGEWSEVDETKAQH